MSEFNHEPSLIELRSAHAEDALRPGGVLHGIARQAEVSGVELSPGDIADIILPPKKPGEQYEARWELIEGAQDVIKTASGLRSSEIFDLATQFDIRRESSITEKELTRIDTQKAVWVIEGGANRTSVVRRQLAIEAASQVYGEHIEYQTVYQFGSDRPIPKIRVDAKTKEEKPNAEYVVAQEIAGEHFPMNDETKQPKEVISEFELNLASARAAGFEIKADSQNPVMPAVKRFIRMKKAGAPELVLVQPESKGGGLVDGFEAVRELAQLDSDYQLIITTNGQYVAKDELQAENWARKKDIPTLSPVAIGDEPGFTVEHNGREITTAERGPMVYVNEIVILHRLNSST